MHRAYIYIYMYIHLGSAAWKRVLRLCLPRIPRNKASRVKRADFIKLTVHARGLSRWRKKERKFLPPFSFSAGEVSRSRDKVYAGFYEPADFVTILFHLFPRCNSLMECFNAR